MAIRDILRSLPVSKNVAIGLGGLGALGVGAALAAVAVLSNFLTLGTSLVVENPITLTMVQTFLRQVLAYELQAKRKRFAVQSARHRQRWRAIIVERHGVALVRCVESLS